MKVIWSPPIPGRVIYVVMFRPHEPGRRLLGAYGIYVSSERRSLALCVRRFLNLLRRFV